MTSDQELHRPNDASLRLPASESQVKYLRYLLVRAHAAGVPYLPVEALSRGAVSAWIDYLRSVTGEFEEPARDGKDPEEGGKPSSPSAGAEPQDVGWLPVVLIASRKFLQDNRRQEYRAVDDPNEWIEFDAILAMERLQRIGRRVEVVPEHRHALDCYWTSDDLEVLFCTRCGEEW
jgi:hypothetical protein